MLRIFATRFAAHFINIIQGLPQIILVQVYGPAHDHDIITYLVVQQPTKPKLLLGGLNRPPFLRAIVAGHVPLIRLEGMSRICIAAAQQPIDFRPILPQVIVAQHDEFFVARHASVISSIVEGHVSKPRMMYVVCDITIGLRPGVVQTERSKCQFGTIVLNIIRNLGRVSNKDPTSPHRYSLPEVRHVPRYFGATHARLHKVAYRWEAAVFVYRFDFYEIIRSHRVGGMMVSERGRESRHRIAHRRDYGREATQAVGRDVLKVIIALYPLGRHGLVEDPAVDSIFTRQRVGSATSPPQVQRYRRPAGLADVEERHRSFDVGDLNLRIRAIQYRGSEIVLGEDIIELS